MISINLETLWGAKVPYDSSAFFGYYNMQGDLNGSCLAAFPLKENLVGGVLFLS